MLDGIWTSEGLNNKGFSQNRFHERDKKHMVLKTNSNSDTFLNSTPLKTRRLGTCTI